MRSENMYRVLVATVFVLLMVVGVYIGVELGSKEKGEIQKEVTVSNTDSIKIYEEDATVEEEEKLTQVDVKFTDVYPDCGHSIETEEHQQETTKEKIRNEIEEKDLGYRLIGEQDGVLLYQKVHTGKCRNHYKVIIEENIVKIYRIGEGGEFEPYQTTDITTDMLREGIKEQLEQGIVVDDIEELLLLMEDIES